MQVTLTRHNHHVYRREIVENSANFDHNYFNLNFRIAHLTDKNIINHHNVR